MRAAFLNALSSRVAKGTYAGLYGQAIILVSQLLSVPLLTAAWGLETYGAWLILYALPGFLALGDLGLASASSGMMIKAVARRDYQAALRIYETSRTLGMIFAVIFCAITLLSLLLFARLSSSQFNSIEQHGWATAALALYALLGVWNGLTSPIFSAANRFATGSMIYYTIVLAEWVAAMGVALMGGSITAVALAYLCVRCGGSMAFAWGVSRHACWASDARLAWHTDTARALLRPAMTALMMPMGAAFAYSGTSVAIGATLGPSAVPVYVALRTVTRTVLQFSMRISFATMPGFALAFARQDIPAADRYGFISIGAVIGLTIPAAAGLMFFADQFVTWWTAGAIVLPEGLVVLLIAVMVCNACWAPLANLITAINRQETISYSYLAIAAGGFLLSFKMAGWFALRGIALTALLTECLMLIAVWRAGTREKIAEPRKMLFLCRTFANKMRLF